MRQKRGVGWKVATVALGASLFGAQNAGAVALKCTKTGKTISDIIAGLKPANGYTEIDVSGKCSDNIYIPPNQAIHLVASSGTTLAAANAANPTVNVDGKLEIDDLAIATGNSSGVAVEKGGYVALLGGSITGPAIAVQVNDNSTILIEDTTISTSGSIAINDSFGSVEIAGVSNLFGSNGTEITNSGNPGLYCAQGNVLLTTTDGGTVKFSGGGLNLSGCTLKAYGSASLPITTTNTGPSSAFLPGLAITGGFAALNYVQVINNNNFGIYANEGAIVELSGTTISGNTDGALNTAQNAVIHIVPYSAINTITEPNTALPLFNCYQGGKIYVDQIANTITPAPTQAQLGCLTVGGP